MIYSLSGNLIFKDANTAVVECSGVGYRCSVTLATAGQLPQTGRKVNLLTHMQVRDDSVELFGFHSQEELRLFRLLISVSGVGPKVGLGVLSDITPDKLTLYIASGDAKAITKAQGIGPKLAQRIILELKDKVMGAVPTEAAMVGLAGSNDPQSGIGEALSALTALGYSQSEAASALSKLDQGLPVQELVRGALKALAMK